MKKKKLIRLLDPEPKVCFVNARDCGNWERPKRTGILEHDILSENIYHYAPKRELINYLEHTPGCLWAQWAMREVARRMK